MPRKSNNESVQDVPAEIVEPVEEVISEEITPTEAVPEEVVEDAISIEEDVQEVETENIVEVVEEPEIVESKIEDIETVEEVKEQPKDESEPIEEIDEASTRFCPTSLIPVYTRPSSQYYDCRMKVSMKLIDLVDHNGFVAVRSAVSGSGVRKLFIRKEHLPTELQSLIVAK